MNSATNPILAPTPENLAFVAEVLRGGGVVAIPTETVYGLAADASSAEAVAKIFALKGRPAINPLIVHVASAEQAWQLTDFSKNQLAGERFRQLLDSDLMPGPLSCVVPHNGTVASAVSAGLPTVCIRIPLHPVAQLILSLSGIALAAPSANKSTEVSPSRAQHVLKSFGDTCPTVIDGGECDIGLESTVVDVTSPQVQILRPGAVTAAQLQAVLMEAVVAVPMHVPDSAESKSLKDSSMQSPGMLLTHYRPKTPLEWLDTATAADASTCGVIYFKENPGSLTFREVRFASREGNHTEIAHELYRLLHEMDALALPAIFIDRCDAEGLGAAILDRLNRAVTPARKS